MTNQLTSQATAVDNPCETPVPLCYQGVGNGPCGVEAACLDRKQPMCGGHAEVPCDSDAALWFGLDKAVAAIPPGELRAIRRQVAPRGGGDRA